MQSARNRWICLLAACLLSGCGSSSENLDKDPPVPTAPPINGSSSNHESSIHATAKTDQSGRTKREFSGIFYMIPNNWNELPNQQFVDAKYTIEHKLGEMQLTLTTAGGGVAANIERWIGQFQRPAGEGYEQKTIDVDGIDATWLDVRGTHTSGFGANQKTHSNWRMLGVAIPNQPRDFYLKLTGSREAIADFQDEFREFVKSGELDR